LNATSINHSQRQKSTTKTVAKERDRLGTRISAKRKTVKAEGEPEGLPEATNCIGVFRTMTSKTAAKERD